MRLVRYGGDDVTAKHRTSAELETGDRTLTMSGGRLMKTDESDRSTISGGSRLHGSGSVMPARQRHLRL